MRFTRCVQPLLLALLVAACGHTEARVLTLGAVLPLSGDNAKYGQWIREGLELYKDELNAHEGVNGARVEIQYEDDQATPRAATSAITKLITLHKVPLVYGSWASSCVLAEAPIAERSHTLVMAQAISPKIRDAGDYIFRGIPDATHSLATLVPFAYGNGRRRIAILYVNNDYGVDQASVFATKFTDLGGQIVFREGYNSDAKNFLPILTKLKAIDFDAVYLPGYTEVAYILKQARELNIQSQFYSSDPFENDDILQIAKDAAEGVFYPFFYIHGRGSSKVGHFEELYKSRYGRYPEGSAALAYNALDVVIAAFRRADTNTEVDRIKAELYRIKGYPGVLGDISIDDHGDMQLQVYIKTVKNGHFVAVD